MKFYERILNPPALADKSVLVVIHQHPYSLVPEEAERYPLLVSISIFSNIAKAAGKYEG